MTDLPPPDLLDERGRLRRLALSFVIALAAGSTAYGICYGLARHDLDTDRGAWRFILYTTGLVFAGVFCLVLAILNKLEKKRYIKSLGPPQAKVRR